MSRPALFSLLVLFYLVLLSTTTVSATGKTKKPTKRGTKRTNKPTKVTKKPSRVRTRRPGVTRKPTKRPTSPPAPRGTRRLVLTIINQAFQQPFSPFFVMVHDESARLYVRGGVASEPLALLAEDGDPLPLVQAFQGQPGVLKAFTPDGGAPLFGGQSTTITVEVNDRYPLVTIASMAINTNDCFVSINGAVLNDGMILDTPGLDAGSEENNERCSLIPG
eukprot:CAMPEP_0202467892 /NCGR_PEP_ID=MMETSP1360-20130828/73630_1 /ASSEMBLY_ACC=CAM_ASM_000848 /TAXON_ID=515479 /ORGANISM="Licmophora paradoxa, Strain CCMP2313" /LENGTH=219 /DNA_ID=CAMNT_0049092605 /DNA_START=229 /DNA_END=884 /DNA_ORIENTATION=+